MVSESRLKSTEHGLVPQGEGWFVVNAREAQSAPVRIFKNTCLKYKVAIKEKLAWKLNTGDNGGRERPTHSEGHDHREHRASSTRRAPLGSARARRDIASFREFLEDLVGGSARTGGTPAWYRLSQRSALWMDKREVATVTTPEGRRDIPLSELLELVEGSTKCAKKASDNRRPSVTDTGSPSRRSTSTGW